LNLACRDNLRQGYINIDTHSNESPSEWYRKGDFESLDWVCEDGSAEEIIAFNALHYLPVNLIKDALQNWYNKLCDGGIIKICAPDIHLISKAFANDQLATRDYLRTVFGAGVENDIRKSAIDEQTLSSILESIGFVIEAKTYNGTDFYIEAVKVANVGN
jgi:hypothetical protein